MEETAEQETETRRTVLMADDDPEDLCLIGDAFRRAGLADALRTVNDGEELLEYLHSPPEGETTPDLILLDLNMPRKDGRETLAEIKADPKLRHIPTVVLTTSAREEDVRACYELGANSYVQKPFTFDSMVAFTETLHHYWFEIVQLPPPIGMKQLSGAGDGERRA